MPQYPRYIYSYVRFFSHESRPRLERLSPFFQRKCSFFMHGHDLRHTQCVSCICKTCLPRITFGLNVLWIQCVYRSVQAIWLQIMRRTLKRLFHHADIRACIGSTFPWCPLTRIEHNALDKHTRRNTRAGQWEMTKLMSDIGDKLPNR